jgi:hypothetical protein
VSVPPRIRGRAWEIVRLVKKRLLVGLVAVKVNQE